VSYNIAIIDNENTNFNPIIVINPALLGFRQGEWIKVTVQVYDGNTWNEVEVYSSQLSSVTEIVVKINLTLKGYTSNTEQLIPHFINIYKSSDGSNWIGIAKYILYSIPKQSIKTLSVSDGELWVTLLARVPIAGKVGDEYVVQYYLVPTVIIKGSTIYIPIPVDQMQYSTYSIIGDTYIFVNVEFNFYYEVMWVKDGELLGYWFGTFQEFKDFTIDKLSKVLYVHKFRIEFKSEDKDIIKSYLASRCRIVEEGDNYLVIELVSGFGSPFAAIFFALLGLAIFAACMATFEKYLEVRKVEAEVERLKLLKEIIKTSGEQTIEYSKLVFERLPPEKAVQVLSKTLPQLAISKEVVEHEEKEKESIIKDFEKLIMWIIFAAIIIALISYLLKR